MRLLIIDLLNSSLFRDVDFAALTISGRKSARQNTSKSKLEPNKINVANGKFLPFAFLSPRLYCKKILLYHTFKNNYILLQI